MPLFDDHPLTDLDRKAHTALGDKVVIKSLAQQAAFHRLPRYVAEYLIAKYVKPDTWHGRVRDGTAPIPHSRMGNRSYYRVAHIEHYIEHGTWPEGMRFNRRGV